MPLREGLAAVRQALDRSRIRVPLSGPDGTDLPELNPAKIDFDPWIGAYDLHSYYARFDWHQGGGYPLAEAEKRLAAWRQWSAEQKKPLFLSELGTMVYGWGTNNPGPSTWQAAIKNAELVVRGLNLHLDGFNRWSFINRGDLDGVWQMIDTWDAGRKKPLDVILPCPNAYFVYGLISRFTAKQSSVAHCELAGGQMDGRSRVFASALQSPKKRPGASRRYHHARPSALINTPLQWGAWPRPRDFFNRFNGLSRISGVVAHTRCALALLLR